MNEKFISWRPTGKSKALLSKINEVLELYRQQGYRLTLRQLYYQLVSRDYIPNNVKSYATTGDLVSNARLSGIIDWDMIEDRVRVAQARQHWNSPAEILGAAANSYYRDHWANQKIHLEVWCEKDAVSNILQPVCSKYDVIFMANRGYSSSSAMYDAYRRFRHASALEQKNIIIYFGDHDPSGIDMTRDVQDRIGLFLYGEQEGEDGKNSWPFDGVEREALNMDQIEKYDPPENPAKVTDSRYNAYVERFGLSSWELDALEPSVLSGLVEEAIKRHIDMEEFEKVNKLIRKHQKLIENAASYLEDE
jgi:hypothetical protein